MFQVNSNDYHQLILRQKPVIYLRSLFMSFDPFLPGCTPLPAAFACAREGLAGEGMRGGDILTFAALRAPMLSVLLTSGFLRFAPLSLGRLACISSPTSASIGQLLEDRILLLAIVNHSTSSLLPPTNSNLILAGHGLPCF